MINIASWFLSRTRPIVSRIDNKQSISQHGRMEEAPLFKKLVNVWFFDLCDLGMVDKTSFRFVRRECIMREIIRLHSSTNVVNKLSKCVQEPTQFVLFKSCLSFSYALLHTALLFFLILYGWFPVYLTALGLCQYWWGEKQTLYLYIFSQIMMVFVKMQILLIGIFLFPWISQV